MADELDAKKLSRRQYKAAVTRQVNKLDRLLSERNTASVKEHYDCLKATFEKFESSHEVYHSLLEQIEDVEASDEYFFDVQRNYSEAMSKVLDWLDKQNKDSDVGPKTHCENKCGTSHAEVLEMASLPKVELQKFDGNPLRYHSFIALFEESVDFITKDDRKRLLRLIDSTEGVAYDAIEPCIKMKTGGYAQARKILERRFGDQHIVTNKIINQLRQGKSAHTSEELRSLSDELSNCVMTLEQLDKLGEVESQSLIIEVIGRFPNYMRNRWKKHAVDFKRNSGKYPNFKEMASFMEKEVDEATDPVYGKVPGVKIRDQNVKPKKMDRISSLSFSTGVYVRPPCILCSQEHKLIYCDKFKNMRLHERVNLVKSKKLCENCLLANHATVNCRNPSVCDVVGCGKKHSKFLHINPSRNVPNNVGITNGVTNASTDVDDQRVFMPIVQVHVNGSHQTGALLDSASSSTFCTRKLADCLGLSGQVKEFTLNTLNKSNESIHSEIVNFHVFSADGRESLNLGNVIVVDRIPVRSTHGDLSVYKHLHDLPLSGCSAEVQILIGQDHAEALAPLELRRGSKGEPFAVRTLLGWTLHGPASVVNTVSRKIVSHFISASTCVGHDINTLWNIENSGIEDLSWSVEDKKVVELWDRECKLVEGRYQIPIPWKPGVCIPNNFKVALSRLRSNKRSLLKKGIFDQYDAEVKNLLSKGYAENIPLGVSSSQSRVWYLPHQAVTSDGKPGKIRIVFDCASRFDGEALNDKCFQGPNLTNNLLNVLLRFRQHSYAVTADVEAMYYQVVIPEEDRDTLRFLWYDDCGRVVQYRMTRHVFGGVWCSASSTYALRRVLSDNVVTDPLVEDTVRRSFYVDDCLSSLPSRDGVLRIVQGASDVLRKGGFRLTKFMINDRELFDTIPVADRSSEVELLSDLHGKALGIRWEVENDVFYFSDRTDQNWVTDVTRRKMLSIVASIFDPLGLVNPLIVLGKLTLQQATSRKLSWDQPIPEDLLSRWVEWCRTLRGLSQIRIPRCVKPVEFNDAALELHHFSDASLSALGCSSYLRCVNKQGQIHVKLIVSKSKVAPIKSMSIPRLELQAAVMAARMDATLRKELDVDLGPSQFWTDSEIVLKYIANESRRFNVFVSNRVSVIHDLTSLEQWHFVPGVENPADLLTRGETPYSLDTIRWFDGPSFLHTFKSTWPEESHGSVLDASDPEVKATSCFLVSDESDPLEKLCLHYSEWYALKRAVAWILRLKLMLSGACKDKGVLRVQELREAEVSILRHAQGRFYASEICLLRKGKSVHKSSSIASLDPIIDEHGLVRVGGRLKLARVSEVNCNPCLVPHNHPIARLIARELHNVAHCGTEWVISEIRKRYWIVRVRTVVKSVAHACVPCKKMFASALNQKMAELPPERLEAFNRPFTFTGMDCFGPFLIKQGRSEVKRYCCLFTCMNTRAVHLEKLNCLETDSFLNAFRRFVARRGMPQKVWSDNGTNFVGGNKEILRNLKDINQKILHEYSLKVDFEWHFNPPTASHYGGVWERLIRTVRKVMMGLLGKDCRLSDEALETLFCEVESMVNGRPLTKVSDSALDASPLTPNHLLMMSGDVSISPGIFTEGDYFRRRWRQVQHLANTFWRRWLKQYLPELQVRAKWYRKKFNLNEGDLVLVLCENVPRGLWPMGLIEEIYRSKDGWVGEQRLGLGIPL